jgi:hypothetical protein
MQAPKTPFAAPHAEQDQHAGTDLRHPLALDVDGGLADPLHERSQMSSWRTAPSYTRGRSGNSRGVRV